MVEVVVEVEDSPALRKLTELMERGEEFEIHFDTYQANTVEYGTGPAAQHANYMPPIEPIYQWVLAKFPRFSEKKALRVARSVQHEIARQGTRPHPFARPAVDDAIMVIDNLVARGVELGSIGRHIAEYIAERAREYMVQNGQVVTGELYRRVFVVEVKA